MANDPNLPFRTERDPLGEVRVPTDALYGAQTGRAASWALSHHRMPPAIVHALARLKGAAAGVHGAAGRLDAALATAIRRAADEVAAGVHDEQFVLPLFQTGSGTSTNMNVNEVLANRAAELLGLARGEKRVHPNDHVNLAQSSNDVVPSAAQLAVLFVGRTRLLPNVERVIERLHELADRHWGQVRDGRTHLMRATPIRFGQQFRGYAAQLEAARDQLAAGIARCAELPLGGTAVGTGIGCPPDFAPATIAALRAAAEDGELFDLREAPIHLGIQGSVDALLAATAAARNAATTFYKLTNDLRWQASDALGELQVKELQPGSSIMPGKVNPVVCEAVLMACAHVLGNDAVVAFANTQGQFELNTMIPLAAHHTLEALELLADAADALRQHLFDGLVLSTGSARAVQHNPMLATALAPVLGYDRAAAIARIATREGRPVFDVAMEQTDLGAERLRELLDPARLCGDAGRERTANGDPDGARGRKRSGEPESRQRDAAE